MRRYSFSDLELPENRRELVDALKSGQIMAYPTDTLYGLGGRADMETVCRSIDRLKTRPEGQVYSVALSSISMLDKIIHCDDPQEKALMKSILPGPYTIVVRLKERYRIPVNQYGETLGIRIPLLPLIQKLIEEIGTPLITTSVNRSGEPALTDPDSIAKQFPSIHLLIDAGNRVNQPPSTLLDISRGQPFSILRRGAGLEQLASIMEQLNLSWTFPSGTVP